VAVIGLALLVLAAGASVTFFGLMSGKPEVDPGDKDRSLTRAPRVVPKSRAKAVVSRRPADTRTPKKVLPASPQGKPVALAQKPAPREQPKPVPHTQSAPPKRLTKVPVKPATVPAKEDKKPERSSFLIVKRRKATASADFLRGQLLNVPELTLDPDGKARKKWLREAGMRWKRALIVARKTGRRTKKQEIVDDLALKLIAKRPDLAGLPVLPNKACRLEPKAARDLEKAATLVREALAGTDSRDRRLRRMSQLPYETLLAANRLYQILGPPPKKSLSTPSPSPRPEGPTLSQTPRVRLKVQSHPTRAALVQLLMDEKKPLRLLLVESLARAKGKRAGAALARRALFDLDPAVREAAVKGLAGRPPEDYRDTLLAGLTYPWVPVADHAAEALVALRRYEVVPRLKQLLRDKNAFGPFVRKVNGVGVWFTRELVRVNHLKSCLLCHAPSFSGEDGIRAAIPSPDRPIPSTRKPTYYYGGFGTIRADVTYLRQDFAVRQEVSNPKKWPKVQRFDFLVRTRPLTAVELAAFKKRGTGPLPAYEQRSAVAFALRELQAQDLARVARALEKVLPKAVPRPRP
jgi:hypothetical protein